MQRTLCNLFLLVWSLWLGGLMFLFFAVTALFNDDHALATRAAPVIFLCFEKYRLVLAFISLILCAALLRKLSDSVWRWIGLCIAAGCVTALISSQYLTPRINALHRAGLGQTPEFRRLHGLSFGIYLLESAMLLIAGAILPAAMNSVWNGRSSAVENKMV